MVPVLIEINLDALVATRASPAQVNTEVDTAIADARLDELLAADSDIDGAAPPTVGSVFHELLTKTVGSFTYDQVTDSLEAIRDKETDIETDTAEIGTAGAGLTALATQASVNVIDDFLDLEIAAILADTNELQTDWVNGGRLDLLIDAIKAQTDLLPAAPAATGDIPTANQNADALLDRAAGIETGLTPRQALRLALAALAGKLSGAATATVTIRDAVADSKDRIVATVDADGNRTAITYDLT